MGMSIEIGMLIKDIPKDYVYDTETNEYVVYRNKYNGHEMKVVRNLEYIPIELYENRLKADMMIMLDKIRVDIERLKYQNTNFDVYRWWNNAIDNCLCEIDKYKEDDEVEE